MIFYGKGFVPLTPADLAGAVHDALARRCATALPIEAHAARIEALIAAGALAQGLADRAAAAAGGETEADPLTRAALDLVLALAREAWASWCGLGGDGHRPVAADAARAAADLARQAGDAPLAIREAEGFAHYAVYPECFALAAAAARPRLAGTVRVLGLRSIGTVLGAMAAAGFGSIALTTVRPSGPVFARSIVATPSLRSALEAGRDALHAVVDEGPGLSGSSLAAAAELLAGCGVEPDRILFLPSHGGAPGPQAAAPVRALFARVPRIHRDFDALVGPDAGPGQRRADWVADLTGPAAGPPSDLSAGAWLGRVRHVTGAEPPLDRQNERRKLLVEGRDRTVLLRFAGLGRLGRLKAERARRLGAAGFTLAPLALRHGFLVEPWRDDLGPLPPGPEATRALLARLPDYLAARAAEPAPARRGADAATLLDLIRVNGAALVGGAEAEAFAGRWSAAVPDIDALARPAATDGRLHAFEWRVTPAGHLIKTDALDHCCGHDIVGCQDLAWDVAGATIEWGLDPDSAEALRRRVEVAAGRPVPRLLCRFFAAAYAAFEGGAFALARDRESDPSVRNRIEATVARYALDLAAAFAA